jgi:hypothetical protein
MGEILLLLYVLHGGSVGRNEIPLQKGRLLRLSHVSASATNRDEMEKLTNAHDDNNCGRRAHPRLV